jgi:hypothetical protein
MAKVRSTGRKRKRSPHVGATLVVAQLAVAVIRTEASSAPTERRLQEIEKNVKKRLNKTIIWYEMD